MIQAEKVIDYIEKYSNNNNNLELILEINSREREPDDSNVVEYISDSLNYWRDALRQKNIDYD